MVSHLFGAKPLSEPMLSYCQLNPNIVIQENAFENAICKMVAI